MAETFICDYFEVVDFEKFTKNGRKRSQKHTTILNFIAEHTECNIKDIVDVTTLISAILQKTSVDLAVADMNNDGTINISDVTALIDYVLSGAGN